MTRYITVPKDKEAEAALDYDQASDSQLIEIVLMDAEFKMLWASGIFEKINLITSSNIDTYEDDSVEGTWKLQKVLDSSTFDTTLYSPNLADLVTQIEQLFVEAKNRDTGVYFYF